MASKSYKKPNPVVQSIKAYALDVMNWTYIALVSYKVIYEKIYLDVRYPEFSWNQPLYALYFGLVLATILSFTKLSLGRGMFGVLKYDENESPAAQPFAYVGYLTIILIKFSLVMIKFVTVLDAIL